MSVCCFIESPSLDCEVWMDSIPALLLHELPKEFVLNERESRAKELWYGSSSSSCCDHALSALFLSHPMSEGDFCTAEVTALVPSLSTSCFGCLRKHTH